MTEKPRILVCRLSSVGDCILSLPVLCALRSRFPRAFIGWVVQDVSAPLLQNHSCLDRVFVVRTGGVRWIGDFPRLCRELRVPRFDFAIDIQGLTKSSLAAWLSGAGERIGFASPQARELAPHLNTTHITATKTHVVERYLELLRPFEIERPVVRFDIPEDAAAEASVAGFLAAAGVRKPFAVFSPGAGWPSKVWPAERYAPVASALRESCGLRCVLVWSGAQERAWCELIAARAGQSCVIAPPTDLRALTALLRKAVLFVGPDTGPLHLAAAVGTPCVGLYGPTDEAVCGPWGSHHAVVRNSEVPVGGMRFSTDETMRAISFERVIEACRRVLDGAPEPGVDG